MRRVRIILFLMAFGALGITAAGQTAAQELPSSSLLESGKDSRLGSLKVCLRLPDETTFQGTARVQVRPEDGEELLGIPGDARGEFLFFAVAPGKYSVDVSAPGFLGARVKTEVEAGGEERSVVVVLKSRVATAGAAKEAGTKTAAETPVTETTTIQEDQRPVTREAEVLLMNPGVSCPAEEVLRGAGQRMREFVSTLEKFTATETLEHYPVGKSGQLKEPAKWESEYAVTLTQAGASAFFVEEFRNGSEDWTKSPGSVATIGLPAMALLFHPAYAGDFDFRCEGLVSKEGRELWQVHFAQREDRPARIESYVVNGSSFHLYLEGRAWIDPGTKQVVRLETELVKPVEAIELVQYRQKISYAPVKFVSTGQSIWLPQEAEVYVERHGKRYFRRHTFRDFKLFSVDTAEKVHAPKGTYSFTNLTDRDITGELTVTPAEETHGGPITLRFPVPAHRTVIKTVGPGKDVNLPAGAVGSAKFVHSGDADSVKVDVDLASETTLDVIPQVALERP